MKTPDADLARGLDRTPLRDPGSLRRLARWLLTAEWRSHPVRVCVAVAAIALGVALGYAVELINGAAFNEFSAAARSLSGQADLQVRGAQPRFDEAWYARLAKLPEVAAASPVLDLDVTVPDRSSPLKVLGIDVFRAARMTPDLIGVPAADRPLDALADDTIFLSPAAQQWLGVGPGGTVSLRSGTALVKFRVAGSLAHARVGQRLAVMDIATAQWRFAELGQLSRVDLQLRRGVDLQGFRNRLQSQLQGQLLVAEPSDDDSRTDHLSRAYRINLNVLALVALFTGAFLVFSTQALTVIRRRSQLALLRVLGLTRTRLLGQILMEGASLGIAGSALGLLLGYGMASTALRFFGGDLGGGYFPGVQPRVHFEWLATVIFLMLGIGVAVLGSLAPALEASRARPAAALKAGSDEAALSRLGRPWPALACLLVSFCFTRLPPVFDLPLFGYLAVALLLIGGIGLMPRLTAIAFYLLQRWREPGAVAGRQNAASLPQPSRRRSVVTGLALARLANAPGQASIALGGVLSSFSLIVAMAIMVSSFRVSVDDWLMHLLAADLYVRAAHGGETGTLNLDEQRLVAATPGVRRADFMRTSRLTLDTARPAVTLMAREIDGADPGRLLQMTGPTLGPSQWGDALPIWVSEAMVDLYGYQVGRRVTLPVGPHLQNFVVAGVWRDYARQTGAIDLRLADYRRLSGDTAATDAALTLQPGVKAQGVETGLRRLKFGDELEFSQPGEIRAITLTIFDRSFAVTYLLEAVAIVIGLFGVAATFSAQALARTREFGMLRHVGVSRFQILSMLAVEGGMLTGLGVAVGFGLGWAISLILVFVVNPQSFHWTMALHIPWLPLAIVAAVLLTAACLTAVGAGLKAVSIDAVRAVREDW
jgi:putative ABC transport system permease protein